jgi:hypothetical protein
MLVCKAGDLLFVGRVMVEELAAARAFYSNQFQDSQQVVQELLNERYELRSSLLQSYKYVAQINHFFAEPHQGFLL